MPDVVYKALYFLAIVAQVVIRAPIDRVRRQNKIVTAQVDRRETVALLALTVGSLLLPLIYTFAPWLNFANYALPAWVRWLGVALLVASLVVFWKAHQDLGRNWSPSLELREGHTLITNGLYNYIRHPMYASQWLFVLAQCLLLPNWLAGVGGLVLFLPLYFGRVPVEEQMMLKEFGDQYRAYAARTGRVLPRLGKSA